MKYLKASAAIAFLTLSVMVGDVSGASRSIDRTIAKINDDIVTESDLAEIVSDLSGQFKSRLGQPFDVATTETVEGMLDRALLLQEARRSKISAPEEELHQQVEDMVNEIKANFATEKEFYQALSTEGVSLDQLQDQLLKKSKTDYMIYQIINSRYSVSDHELAGFQASQTIAGRDMNSYRLRRLGIPITKTEDSQAARVKALALVAQIITEGISFEEGIRRYSQVPGAALDGGDMGYMASDKLSAEVRAAIQNLEVGQASTPVVAGGYVNIFYMDSKRGAKSALREQKFFTTREELLTKLRHKAILQVFDERMLKLIPDDYRSALTGNSGGGKPSASSGSASSPILRALDSPPLDSGTAAQTPASANAQLPVSGEEAGFNSSAYSTVVAPSPTPIPQQRRFPRWFGSHQ